MKKGNTVRIKIDPDNPPRLTAAQRKRLSALAKTPDSKIDYSDIPPLGKDIKWTRPGALVSPENKKQVTLRLDADVLGFFKKTGQRYQSRINAALREYMNAHRKAAE